MRKTLARRLDLVATRNGVDEPYFIRIVTVVNPNLPDDDQDRWLALAEAAVDDDLCQQRVRKVMLCSRVDSPGMVTVDSPRGRYRVEIDEELATPVARIVERNVRRW